MFSNDPRDVIRKKLMDAQNKGEEPELPKSIDGNIHVDNVTVDQTTGEQVQMPPNPVGAKNFSFTAFAIGTIFAHWYYTITKMWWWIPVMAAFLFAFVDGGAMADMVAQQGITIGAVLKDAAFWAVAASVWAVFPPWIIGVRMRRGDPVTRGQMVMLSIPGTLVTFMVFYDIAFIIYMLFSGLV